MVCKRSPSSYIRAGVTRILWIWRHDAKEGSQLVYIPQLLFRVKKEWLDTRKDIHDWSRVRIASFFTRCISPGSSATPCLIWLRWRLGPLHTDSYAGIPTNHNYLNISIIRKMLANFYIISFLVVVLFRLKNVEGSIFKIFIYNDLSVTAYFESICFMWSFYENFMQGFWV